MEAQIRMNSDKPFAMKQFTMVDQEIFAQFSGDSNPMHVDTMAARRTQAGSPVVHGVNALLWSLDCLFFRLPAGTRLLGIHVEFNKWLLVGKLVNATLSEISERRAKVRLEVDAVSVAVISIDFHHASAAELHISQSLWEPVPMLDAALEPDLDELSECAGVVGFASVPSRLAIAWPSLAGVIGSTGIAALMATSTLVGMRCPGLHSIYKELIVEFCCIPSPNNEVGLSYKVEAYDERFRLVTIRIEGRGAGYKFITGTVKAIAKLPPVKQPSVYELSKWINPNEFSQSCSLIIGGSRGLGELTAKALVAGGGKVIITYAVGKADAERVSQEIVNAGGACEIMHYDVRSPTATQLARLSGAVTHVYYYATPTIFQSKSKLFVEARFSLFVDFYLKTFFDLCNVIRPKRDRNVRILYPSSVFVNERPPDMTEYAMAKSAGEVLCADINRFLDGVQVLVRRLPRLETDQTVGVAPMKKTDSISILLPVLREMCAKNLSS
jgi:acyl dehydratase